MKPRNYYLYSAAAASRLTGIPVDQLIVEEWAHCVWIRHIGYGARFISKLEFKIHFVAFRQQASKSIAVRNIQGSWIADSARDKSKAYQIDLAPSGPECACRDYRNQIETIGRGCCKHGYAVLAALGHGSLSDYIQAQGQRVAA